MTEDRKSIIKLGIFVLAGLAVLIFSLYIVGLSRNVFGSPIEIRTRFKSANGLQPGNNIFFSGIKVGTVKSIKLLKDTAVEVSMLIDDRLAPHIAKGATATIASEGVIGKKIVNIQPGAGSDLPVQEGDLLLAGRSFNKDDLLLRLDNTNENIQDISSELVILVHRVNASKALWATLNDESLPANINATLYNISDAARRVNRMSQFLEQISGEVTAGKGTVGLLLADTGFAGDLKRAIAKIEVLGDKAISLADEANSMTRDIHHDVNYGQGPIHAILTDSALVRKLDLSLDNIQRGTGAFDQDLEALKHSWLLRGYFRRLAKNRKDSAK